MLRSRILLVMMIVCVSAGRRHNVDMDEDHDDDYDHEAILGTKHRSTEELEDLVDKMDLDKDGFVSKDELSSWITKSFIRLNAEDLKDKMQDIDADNDGKVTWAEYRESTFGGHTDQELLDMEKGSDADDKSTGKKANEDRRRFQFADADKDESLNEEELGVLLHPQDHEPAVAHELDMLITDNDKNNDGALDFQEYYHHISPGGGDDEEEEKTYFTTGDLDKDEKLNREELKKLLYPGQAQFVSDEVEHLYKETDDDNDSKLSKEEIIEKESLWIGSPATGYGERDEL